jgi:cytochrome c peroxidase
MGFLAFLLLAILLLAALVLAMSAPARFWLGAGLAMVAANTLGAASPDRSDSGMSRAAVYRQARELSALGRQMFRDPALSASGQLACATCHSPAHAMGPPDGRAVQAGGKDMRQPGRRAVPSLKYLQAAPQFTEHFFESDSEGDESVDNGPTGGLTWDGRVDRGGDQARLPLLSPWEMANESPSDVVAKVRKAGYGETLRRIFGADVLDETDTAFKAVLKAFEVYEQDAAEFYPYNSKYDAYLAGKAQFTPSQARGLALFNDPAKGNCAQCHISKPGGDGGPPQFTDYGLIAIGAPRNDTIPANSDPRYFDLGLCGPYRTDFNDRAKYCGLFMTPTLRNVATRQTFMHNGVFQTLRQVLEFYVERDTHPAKWYRGEPDGRVRKYDDLPAAYQANVNVDPPFDRKPGDPPALTSQEIDDIIAFLGTLTDGYSPSL